MIAWSRSTISNVFRCAKNFIMSFISFGLRFL